MNDSSYPSDWMRAVLGLCILKVLEGGPSYGYAITAELSAAGLGEIKGGTLYPLLTRYEQRGLISSQWQAGESGPGRKYFALTDVGQQEFDSLRDTWGDFSQTMTRHLHTSSEQNS